MLSKLWRGLLFALIAYVLAALISHQLVLRLSPRHDRELEAAMTSVFFYGPAAAALSFALSLLL